MDFRTNVAIYLRKSRMDPEDESIDETLNRHYDSLLKYAREQKLNITEVYKEVVSGDGLFTRPEMLRLLRDIESTKYTAVLCMAIDRLGRSSQKDGGIILETFKDHDVAIITPQKTYDLNDDIDETSVEMQSFLARQELKSIKRRLTAGMKKSLEDGFHITEPPYGYRRVYINKRPTLEKYEEEAAVVRMIFDMYVNQGLGSQVISEKLNDMGLTPRKNDHFSRNTIRFMLQNPVYKGKIVWNRKHRAKKKSIHDKNRYIKNPEEKWIVSNGVHPAIISEELFNKAEEIRLTRTHPPSFTGTLKNPFAGLVYCENCGSAIVRQCMNAKRHISLLCPNTGCTRSIQLHVFEEEVLNAIRTISHDAGIESKRNPKNIKDETVPLKLALHQFRIELKNITTQRNKLHDLLERGIYNDETFIERSKHLSERQQRIEQQIAETEEQLHEKKTVRTFNEVKPFINTLLNNYEHLSPAEKNGLYKKIISRITYCHTPEQSRTEFTMKIEWSFEM